MTHSRSRTRTEDGAAAVEFALVSSLLFVLVFGIIQYGFYFNDSMDVRQGVREASRMGVVRNFATDPRCTSASDDMARLRCTTAIQINPAATSAQLTAGTSGVYVKVVKPATWAKTQPLVVCAVSKSSGASGMLPMPDGGYVSGSTQMSIEQDAAPLPTGVTTSDPLPSGLTYPC